MSEKTTLDKVVKISIIIGALIIALSIAYYLVIFLPKKEKELLQREQQSKQESQKGLEDCLSKAKEKAAGLTDSDSDTVFKFVNTLDNECFNQYPQN